MKNKVEKARIEWLEWFDNFCITGGDPQVARHLSDSFFKYQELSQAYYQEME